MNSPWSRISFAALATLLICGPLRPAVAQDVHLQASSKQLKVQHSPQMLRTGKHSPYMPQPERDTDDSANADPPKSWVRNNKPDGCDLNFLNGLAWSSHPIGAGYNLRTGIIFDKWIAAMQFTRAGKLIMTEYTPPQEYVTVVDAITGKPAPEGSWARDANGDGVLEIAFLHQKLHDPKYHMYTIYALETKAPKLLWKSGGSIGDWLNQTK